MVPPSRTYCSKRVALRNEGFDNMKTIVPVKQVPETSNVKMDSETGTIVRSGRQSVVNPLDLYAIEAALTLRERVGGSVTALSMGPPSATKALKEVLAMGCDEAVLISDKKFSGSDTWATSYIISRGITSLGDFDLVICGERATDGDTAQVGPGIAAWLELSLATYVSAIGAVETLSTENSRLSVERLMEEGYQKLTMELPALITVVKEIAEPRIPTLDGKKRAMNMDIPVLNSDSMSMNPSFIGLNGSPTKVVKIRTPQVAREGRTVHAEGNVPGAITELIEYLKEKELV